MLRKDYILRQFEEFGKVLAQILGFKKSGDWEKFEEEIAAAAQRFTALEISQVEQMDAATFGREVVQREGLELDQKKMLAELLFEKMNFYLEKENKERYLALRDRCLQLYKHIQQNFTEHEFDLNVHYRIEFLSRITDQQ